MSERKSNEELGGGDSELSPSNAPNLDYQDGVESATIPQGPVALLDVTGLNPGSDSRNNAPADGITANLLLALGAEAFVSHVPPRGDVPGMRPTESSPAFAAGRAPTHAYSPSSYAVTDGGLGNLLARLPMAAAATSAASPNNTPNNDPVLTAALASLVSSPRTTFAHPAANVHEQRSSIEAGLAASVLSSSGLLGNRLTRVNDNALPSRATTANPWSILSAQTGGGLGDVDRQLFLLASRLRGGPPPTGLAGIDHLQARLGQPNRTFPQLQSQQGMMQLLSRRNFGVSIPDALECYPRNVLQQQRQQQQNNAQLLASLVNMADTAILSHRSSATTDTSENPPRVAPNAPSRKRKAAKKIETSSSKSPRLLGTGISEDAFESGATLQEDDQKKPAAITETGVTRDDTPSPPHPANNGLPLLYNATDEGRLSKFQILARKQVEFFEATAQDLEASCQGRNRPILLGQVGIRCRHCSRLPNRQRMRASTYYPSTMAGIYQSAQNIFKGHLTQRCQCISAHTRDALIRYQTNAKSGCGGGKKYWLECAQQLDLEDDENGGLRYKKNHLKPGATAVAESKITSSPVEEEAGCLPLAAGRSDFEALRAATSPTSLSAVSSTPVTISMADDARAPPASSSFASQGFSFPRKEGNVEAEEK